MTEVIAGVLAFAGLSILALLLRLWYESDRLQPIGRRNAVVENPSGEESRRDLAISAAIVVACMAGTVTVAAVVVWLLR